MTKNKNGTLPYIVSFFLPMIFVLAALACVNIFPFGSKAITASDLGIQYLPITVAAAEKIKHFAFYPISYECGFGVNMFAFCSIFFSSVFNLLFLAVKAAYFQEVYLVIYLGKERLIIPF